MCFTVVLINCFLSTIEIYFFTRVLSVFPSSQDGVNWLSFLNKYKLHGILCDDMGLGKTLQSICILAGDHYLRYSHTKKTPQTAGHGLLLQTLKI